MTLDRETLEQAAEEALKRPSDAMFWDDRLFNTHGAVFHWAERGDDLLEESNYLTALDLIRAAADDGRPDTEVSDEQVIDGTSRHWLVGSLRTIYVQVYDEDGEFTPAFAKATELALSLQDYPILDESDYSEREWKAYEETLSEALDHAEREYWSDTEQEQAAIRERFYEGPAQHLDWHRAEDVDWDKVAEEYGKVRDAHFEERVRQLLYSVHPDQGVLFAA